MLLTVSDVRSYRSTSLTRFRSNKPLPMILLERPVRHAADQCVSNGLLRGLYFKESATNMQWKNDEEYDRYIRRRRWRDRFVYRRLAMGASLLVAVALFVVAVLARVDLKAL